MGYAYGAQAYGAQASELALLGFAKGYSFKSCLNVNEIDIQAVTASKTKVGAPEAPGGMLVGHDGLLVAGRAGARLRRQSY